jgi:isocitrate/isopropylmalate dehydrogenase
MLTERGDSDEGKKIEAAVQGTLEDGILTPDLGGRNTTDDVTNGVIQRLL